MTRPDLPVPANPSGSEASLRLLLEQMPALLWTTDRNLRFTSAQGAGLTSRGYTASEFLGHGLYEFYGTEDRTHPSIAAHLRALQGVSSAYEDQVWDSTWESLVEPLKDADGQIVGVVGISIDVSARKRAEDSQAAAQAALRESEARLRLLASQTPAVLWSTDPELRITSAHGATLQAIGLPNELLIGRTMAEVIADGDPARRLAPYRRVLAGESLEYESEFRGRALEVHLQPLRGEAGVIIGTVGVGLDITERKRAEQALQQSETQLRMMTDQLPAVVWTTDTQLHFISVRGAGLRGLGLRPADLLGVTTLDVLNEAGPSQQVLLASLKALAGESVTVEPEAGGRVFDAHLDPLRDAEGRIVGTVGIALDVTERKHAEALRDAARRELQSAYQSLEQRVADRTRELSTLLKIARDVASTLELRPLLSLILDQLQLVSESSGAALAVVEGDQLVILESRGASAAEREEQAIGLRLSLARLGGIWEAAQRGEAVIIDDVCGDGALARDFRAALGPQLDAPPFEYIRSWLAVPLIHHGQVKGLMSQSYRRPSYYGRHHAELALAIAHQAAVAIENARLYEQAQEEARKRAALARIASSVALGGPLELALDVLARSVVEASGAVACSLMVAMGNPPQLRLMGAYGQPAGYTAAVNEILRDGYLTLSAQSYDEPGPQRTHDVRAYALAQPHYAPIHRFMHLVTWDTMISLPSIYQGRHVARLNLYYEPGHEAGDTEMAFLAAIADQAAIAIENARLYSEAEAKAALEERQRLARELHDSVSQALYGIVLGAETARAYLDADPPLAARPLEYVRSLADAGLAEMKALIFELRPESLEREGLVMALVKQASALRARHNVQVATAFGEEPPLTLDGKEALYRIAQEALHNIIKHAEANHVQVRLTCDAGRATLEVRDDGTGFDPSGEFPGHLGLKSMRERAQRAGGSLDVESSPGSGTIVLASVPLASR